ncbi:MAG: hypothetical protein JRD89_00615 [Deltaproteobacteria bacterium]|nr:hypothetical protein [Deltaproteobacteria bacterium]
MAPQLPSLTSLTKVLRTPEIQFENMLKSAGIQLPPGPQAMLLNLQQSLEAGGAPTLPSLPSGLPKIAGFPELPKLPSIEQVTGALPKLPGATVAAGPAAAPRAGGVAPEAAVFAGGRSLDSERAIVL